MAVTRNSTPASDAPTTSKRGRSTKNVEKETPRAPTLEEDSDSDDEEPVKKKSRGRKPKTETFVKAVAIRFEVEENHPFFNLNNKVEAVTVDKIVGFNAGTIKLEDVNLLTIVLFLEKF